jgi:large subunit ribosomal protein L16
MNLFKKTSPKKSKKCRKNKLKKLEFKATKLKFGTLGLKAIESGVITSNQLLSAKQAILKKIKKKNKI